MIRFFFLTLLLGIMNIIPISSQNNSFNLYPDYINYLNAKDSLTKSAFYFKAKTDEKIVCLSFDDGPSKAYTEKLTTFLKEKNCPAIFFILGEQIKKELIVLYEDTLFEVGCHSFNHYNYKKVLDVDLMFKDFQQAIMMHDSLMSGKLKYYRPPYGVINDSMVEIMKSFNLDGVLWSFDFDDYLLHKEVSEKKVFEKKVLDNINEKLSNGDIILLHEKISLTLLNDIINLIREKGFKIVQLSELIKYQNVIP